MSDSATSWTTVLQVPLSSTISWSLLTFMPIELVMPSNHLILFALFSFCLQSFLASRSFLMNQLFASGGQSSGASVSASVLPMTIQELFSWGLTDLTSLLSKGHLRVFFSTAIWKHQILQCSAFFIVQLSRPYMTMGKNHSLDLCWQSNVSAFQYAI